MSENVLELVAQKLLAETIEHLRKKIASGEATASDVKNAIQLLKDNDITCEVRKGTALAELYDELPFEENEVN